MEYKRIVKLATTGMAALMLATSAPAIYDYVTHIPITYAAENEGNSEAKFNVDAAVKWYEDRKGKVSYTQGGSRNGPDSYDCSSSVTYALDAGGIKFGGSWAFNTDSLHDWLLKNNFELVSESDWGSDAEIGKTQRGDIFIWGPKGASGGDLGHTGMFKGDDEIIHCSFPRGIDTDTYSTYKHQVGSHGKVYIYRSKSVSSSKAEPLSAKRDHTVKGSISYTTSELVNGLKQIFTIDKLKSEDAKDSGDKGSQKDTKDGKATPEETNLARFATNPSGQAVTNAGNLGALLGFSDVPSEILDNATDEDAIFGSPSAKNGVTYKYETVRNLRYPIVSKGGENTYGSTDGFYIYLTYGRALTDLGLISTDRANLGTVVLTWVLMLVYLASQLVPAMFTVLLWVLSVFNPFAWLAMLTSKGGDLMQGAIDGGHMPEKLRPVAQLLADAYDGISNLVTTVYFPVLLALGVGLLFLGNSQKGKTILRTFGTRVFIQTIGVALLGSIYTSGLTQARQLAPNMASMGSFANYLVSTTFVRVDDWARNTRMAVPTAEGNLALGDGSGIINYDTETGRGTLNAKSYRQGVAAINLLAAKRGNEADALNAMVDTMSFITNKSGESQLATNAEYDKTVDASTSGSSFNLDIRKVFSNYNNYYGFDLLKTYMLVGSNDYSASKYETDMQSAIKQDDDLNKAYNGLVNFRIKDLKATKSLLARNASSYDTLLDDDSKKSTFGLSLNLYPANIYNNGSLTGSGKRTINFYQEGGNSDISGMDPRAHIKAAGGTNAQGPNVQLGDSTIDGFGLSDLSMYNFLATKFDVNGATVTAHTQSNSGQVTNTYQAVTLAGRGWHSVMTVVEDIVVLGGACLIAYFTIGLTIIRISGLLGGLPVGMVKTAMSSIKGFFTLMTQTSGILVYVVVGGFAYIVLSELYIAILRLAPFVGNGSLTFGTILGLW